MVWKKKNVPPKTPSTSPSSVPSRSSAVPKSPVTRVGVQKTFRSQRMIVSTTGTFNYVKDPLTDGSTGYFMYRDNKNMLEWAVALPLNFTHAKVFKGREEMIFEFKHPNSSDTYGKFVKGETNPPNFFTTSMDLGTFF